ncbi:hypothetical protein BC940DRAFT_302965 [Gongronella butleri]|nr:hypothetical protein BC940DRAFT_302965 [Gongronella butleri]
MKLASILLLGVTSVFADSRCSKNAWVGVNVLSVDYEIVRADVYIQSGKNHDDISIDELTSGLSRCLFEGGRCTMPGGKDWIQCTSNYQWQSSRWTGEVDIEFDCNFGGVSCYQADWTQT